MYNNVHGGAVPYTVSAKGGRFLVTSPAGKTWKTSYASEAAADKAITYIENRFGGSAGIQTETATPGIVEAEHLSTQDLLDMEAKGERGTKTLLHLRNKESSF